MKLYRIMHPSGYMDDCWDLSLWQLMVLPLQYVWLINNFIDEWTDPEDTWS